MRCSYQLMPDVYEPLKSYQYPGNVRELRNILFIAATHSVNRKIDAALVESVINNLPHCNELLESAISEMNHGVSTATLSADSAKQSKEPLTLKDIEAQHVKDLLDQHQGNRKKAADSLGISERTMYRKLKSLGIN